MFIDTRSKESMESSMSTYLDIPVDELYQYIDYAAEKAQKDQWAFNIDLFYEELGNIISDLQPEIEIDELLFFHLSRRLRYVNQINLPSEKKPRKSWYNYWNKYISDALVKPLAFVDNDSALARHMSSVEMNYGDYLLRFQYGIFNPDYPAANKKNIYVIDTDIYATGLIDSDDVKAYAAEFHAKANEWFEKAIKQELRDKLGGVGTHA